MRRSAVSSQLFIAAIEMLDYTTEICTNKSLSGFKWYIYMHIPMPGCLFLASELRRRTTGELCERAWKALHDYFNNGGIGCNMRSPVHSDISNMLLSAWDGHEEAERQQGRVAQPPELVVLLRQRLRKSTVHLDFKLWLRRMIRLESRFELIVDT